MSDLAKALADKALQADVRRALKERLGYDVEPDLPKTLQEKLEELDRVTNERTKP